MTFIGLRNPGYFANNPCGGAEEVVAGPAIESAAKGAGEAAAGMAGEGALAPAEFAANAGAAVPGLAEAAPGTLGAIAGEGALAPAEFAANAGAAVPGMAEAAPGTLAAPGAPGAAAPQGPTPLQQATQPGAMQGAPAAQTPTATSLPTGTGAGVDAVPGGDTTPPGVPAQQAPAPVETRVPVPNVPPAEVPGWQKALQSLGVLQKGSDIALGPTALPLALTGVNAAQQRAMMQSSKSLPGQLRAAAGPAQGAATQLLEEGLGGKVNPATAAMYEKTFQDKVGEIKQRYANMGRDANTDSAAQYEIQRAQDARDAAIAGQASSLTSQGLQAAQIAQGPTTQAALSAAQQDQALSNAMAQALQQIAQIQAMGNRAQQPIILNTTSGTPTQAQV